ncbi:MAG: cysteine desulfurase [Alphaproteobacteria bacterium]|nr:cysteine desulfurase [Alphaproteobacteria bacterium]
MNKERIYLDHNATTPLLAEARSATMQALELPGNPSSVHEEGRAARAVVEKARRQVAQLVNADPAGVVFTSGATEAAATVLTPHFKMGKADLTVGQLLIGAADHPCILAGGRFDPRQVTRIDVDHNGQIHLQALEGALAGQDEASRPAMVCLMLANNETGIVQEMGLASDIVKRHGGILVVDAVQAAGRIPVDLKALGADFVILSSHKIGGPKGAGALVCGSEILRPVPLVPGGGQEKGHRSGTENPAAIAGFGAAAEHVTARLADDPERIAELRDRLEFGILKKCADCLIYGAEAERLPNTVFFAIPGMKAETAQIAFDLAGIAVSAGSACSSGKVGPSHVLAAMGFDAEQGGIRVSLGPETSTGDIEAFLSAFEGIVSNRIAAS